MTITVEEDSTELVSDIQNLQNIELDLFDTLEKGIANNTLSADDKTKLIDQISQVSGMRVNLFTSLNNINTHYQSTVTNSGNVISQQIGALNVVENELNEAKLRLKAIEEDRNSKLRLVEINTYYGEKYADHTNIMKTVVYFCIPIILLTILANMGILPRFIYNILLIILIVWAIINLGVKLIYAMSHDNMNYQEYVWGQEPPTSPPIDTSNSSGTNPWYTSGDTCVAQECCSDGFTYVPSPTNMCVANADLPAGVAPYNPSQAVSVTSSSSSSSSTIGSMISDIGSSAANTDITSAASGIASTATQSVASVYSSLANL